MLSKTVSSISRSTSDMFSDSVDMVRGLTWLETGDLLRFAGRRLNEEKLPQVAGSLTFTTTLALVPLVTIILAIFTTFPVFSSFRTALDNYFVQSLMPRTISNTVISNLTQFASKAKSLSAVGAAALLITSSAMMGMIERIFNQIWRVRKQRPVLQRVMVYWALLTFGPILFGLSLTVTSQLFLATSSLADVAPFFSALFYTIISVALTTGAYTLLYTAVPNRYVDWRDAMWGALVAALAFEVAKRGFGVFIRQFPTYTLIYGALAALPLFLIWIYLSWMITLVGAVLASALPVIKYERWWHQPAPGSAFVDAMALLQVLESSARTTGTALTNSAVIRAKTRIGFEEMTTLLDQMVAAGWVGRVQSDLPATTRWGHKAREGLDDWVLLIDPDKLKLADVYRMFVFGGVTASPQHDDDQAVDAAMLARKVEDAVEKGLDQTLAQHVQAI
jgi:membrane protein